MSEHVLNEEARRKGKQSVSSDKGTALVASATAFGSSRNNNRRINTPGASCAYCRMKNHEHTQCFQLNDYPHGHKLYNPHFVKPAWQPSSASANIAASSSPRQLACGRNAVVRLDSSTGRRTSHRH